jgi:hypothetical protein
MVVRQTGAGDQDAGYRVRPVARILPGAFGRSKVFMGFDRTANRGERGSGFTLNPSLFTLHGFT